MDAVKVQQPVNNCTAPTEPGEEWRWIPDDRVVEHTYQVSNLGNVRNVETGHILKLSVPKKIGYRIAVLPHKDNRAKKVGLYVHRMVAVLFLPPPLPGQTQVDHIDGDRLNNRFDNLRWVTPGENLMNPITRQHARESYASRSEKLSIPVICISDNNRPFPSITAAAKHYGIDPDRVGYSCRHHGEPVKRVVTELCGQPVLRFRYADTGSLKLEEASEDPEPVRVIYNAKPVVYMGDKKDRWFPTIKAAARASGVTPVGIAKACNLYATGARRNQRAGSIKLLFRWATPEDAPQQEEQKES